jgi:hypothetical protein
MPTARPELQCGHSEILATTTGVVTALASKHSVAAESKA